MGKTRRHTPKHYYASPDYRSDTPPMSEPTPYADYESLMAEWERDCLEWRGMVLTGRHAHWCPTWNHLPMDETCPEWPCGCGLEDGGILSA